MSISGVLRVAFIDLRGSFARFWVLIACLALGVGTIAMVGAVGASVQQALNRDARLLLGGDLEARLTWRAADDGERAYFASLGKVAEVIDLLTRTQSGDEGAFVALRAVDARYPLLGSVDSGGAGELPALLATREGVPGALADPLLLDALGIGVGDRIEIGSATLEIRGVLNSVPDHVTEGFSVGMPLLTSIAGVEQTGLLRPGGLARYRYKMVLSPPHTFEEVAAEIAEKFPDAGWQLTGPEQANEDLGRYFGIFQRFLVIVALTALLVGGIGVANAMWSYILDHQREIATFKAMGATRRRVLAHYLAQALILVGIGIAIGAFLGALLSVVALPFMGPAVGLHLSPMVDWPSLGIAAVFGLLVGFAFTYLPAYRAGATRPAILFRTMGVPLAAGGFWRARMRADLVMPMLAAAAALFGMAVLVTHDVLMVLWYAIGALVAFAVLGAAAAVLKAVLVLIPPVANPLLRNALKAIYRPGTAAPTVIMSMGLGMALLIIIATMVNNLRHQLDPEVRVDAPDFVYMDLFADEAAGIAALAGTDPAVVRSETFPVVRSSTLALNGSPLELDMVPRDISAYFGDEQPLTVAAQLPEGNELVEGKWWAEDYSGPPLVSITDQLATEGHVKVGDTLTFTIFGEPFSAKVASARTFEWQKGRINFPFLLSPGALDNYPLSYFAFVRAAPGEKLAVQRELTARFPYLSFIPVDEALQAAQQLIDSISTAIAIVGTIAVVSGLLVLSGALAAGRRQREAEAVIHKVLGATRRDVVLGYAIEYGLISVLSAGLALGLGLLGAWLLTRYTFDTTFTADPLLLAGVVLAALCVTVAVGAAATWGALSVRPARALREE